MALIRKIHKHYVDLELFGSDDLKRLTRGILWFKRGSENDGLPPTKHAIRITDVIVARASALLTHLSVMLAVSAVILQIYYPIGKPYDLSAYFLTIEMLAYLALTLLCLQTIYLSGPSPAHDDDENIIATKAEHSVAKKLLEKLKQQAVDNTSKESEHIADAIAFYAKWSRKENGFVSDLDEQFANYTLLVLRRRIWYIRALFGTYSVTILFLLTVGVKLLR